MDFFDAIAKQMPKNAPGSLSQTDNLATQRHSSFASNGYAAGAERLAMTGSCRTLPMAPQAQAAAVAAPSGPPAVFPQPADHRAAGEQQHAAGCATAARSGCRLADVQPDARGRPVLALDPDQRR